MKRGSRAAFLDRVDRAQESIGCLIGARGGAVTGFSVRDDANPEDAFFAHGDRKYGLTFEQEILDAEAAFVDDLGAADLAPVVRDEIADASAVDLFVGDGEED